MAALGFFSLECRCHSVRTAAVPIDRLKAAVSAMGRSLFLAALKTGRPAVLKNLMNVCNEAKAELQ